MDGLSLLYFQGIQIFQQQDHSLATLLPCQRRAHRFRPVGSPLASFSVEYEWAMVLREGRKGNPSESGPSMIMRGKKGATRPSTFSIFSPSRRKGSKEISSPCFESTAGRRILWEGSPSISSGDCIKRWRKRHWTTGR